MLLNLSSPTSDHQRGVALIMALVFLTLLTILGVTAMSTSSLEEKMATNTRDRNLAFHAAETALLAAETWMASLTPPEPAPWPVAAKGRYDFDSAAAYPIWETVVWDGTNVVAYPCTPDDTTPSDSSSCVNGTTKIEISKVMTQPKYIIEKMGLADSTVPNNFAYRITARGTGGSNAAVVMLQSVYVRAF